MQRHQRIAQGIETEADRRAEHFSGIEQRQLEHLEKRERDDWVEL